MKKYRFHGNGPLQIFSKADSQSRGKTNPSSHVSANNYRRGNSSGARRRRRGTRRENRSAREGRKRSSWRRQSVISSVIDHRRVPPWLAERPGLRPEYDAPIGSGPGWENLLPRTSMPVGRDDLSQWRSSPRRLRFPADTMMRSRNSTRRRKCWRFFETGRTAAHGHHVMGKIHFLSVIGYYGISLQIQPTVFY